MATAGQLRELRRKYHLGEFRRDSSPTKSYSKKRGRARARRVSGRNKKGGTMARRKSSRRGRRSFGAGGIMGMVKPVIIGTAGGLIAPRVPLLNTLPYSQAIGGAVACFALGQKAPVKLAIGAASGQYVAPMVNQWSGGRIY